MIQCDLVRQTIGSWSIVAPVDDSTPFPISSAVEIDIPSTFPAAQFSREEIAFCPAKIIGYNFNSKLQLSRSRQTGSRLTTYVQTDMLLEPIHFQTFGTDTGFFSL